MATISTDFKVPESQDKVVIAIQDTINQMKWQVLETTSSRFVVLTPVPNTPNTVLVPKLTLDLRPEDDGTMIQATISVFGPMSLGWKKPLAGTLGQLVNSISLRIQTNSVAINPTVAIGDGQVSPSMPLAAPESRLNQLERLATLFKSGVLTEEEFSIEKSRIIGHDGPQN